MSPGRCPACGGSLAPWRDVLPAEPAGVQLVGLLRCERCLTAVTDAPAPPAAHDTGAYATHRPRLAPAAGPLLERFDRRRLRLLGSPGPRLLDVGAGRGRFVAAARQAGFDAEGIEPSSRGIRAAREQYGVELRPEEIATATLPPDRLDAVTLWHVLEHLDDPAAALAAIAGWLRPGGVILVGVPNLSSLQAKIGGARWFHLDVPRHRTHFTPSGLALLLAGTGLEIVHTTQVLAEHNPFGMWQSIVNRLTDRPSYLYNLLKRNAPLAPGDLAITLAALPLVPLAAGLELAAGLTGHGGTIAVLARRPAPTGPAPPEHLPAGSPAATPQPPGVVMIAIHSHTREARLPVALGSASWTGSKASAGCSGIPRSSSGGWPSSPSRCRVSSGWRGPTTRSSSPST